MEGRARQSALYSQAQLREYYHRIDLPAKYRYEPGDFSREVVRQRDGIGYLTALVRHTLQSVPFENLALHYSPNPQITPDPNALYQKIVSARGGRGGYCFENNTFFNVVLRSCGYSVYSVGARVNQNLPSGDASGPISDAPVSYGGLQHLVNLVTLRGDVYLVDVGFGPGAPTRPVPLGTPTDTPGFVSDPSVRLVQGAAAGLGERSQGLWTLERRIGEADAPRWVPLYCFSTETELFHQDTEVLNYYTSTNRKSFFTYRVICWKAVLSDDGESVIGELLLLGNKLYRKRNGSTEATLNFTTEQERVAALDRFFDVKLSQVERDGIQGSATALASN